MSKVTKLKVSVDAFHRQGDNLICECFKNTVLMLETLADVINKKQGRVLLADMPEAFASIKNFPVARMNEANVNKIVHALRSRRA
jgi:hypothetical protein